MKITICGSTAFIKEMKEVKEKLLELGHEVLMPLSAETGEDKEYWDGLSQNNLEKFATIKGERMIGHFNKVKSSDAILVLNYDKTGKKNYIGGNTFLEMAIAFDNNKKIFLLNEVPTDSAYFEELVSMKLTVVNGDLKKIV